MNADFFDCSFCGARHDLARDRRALIGGMYRGPVHGHHGKPPQRAPEDYVVLMRAFRYRADHAKRAITELALREERVAA
jgi:hypothetical protein